MRLIDHHQLGATNLGKLSHEPLIGKSFGRDNEGIDIVEACVYVIPLAPVVAIYSNGLDIKRSSRVNLIFHKGKERTDDESRPSAVLSENFSCNEIDERLSPACLFNEKTVTSRHNRFYRFELV